VAEHGGGGRGAKEEGPGTRSLKRRPNKIFNMDSDSMEMAIEKVLQIRGSLISLGNTYYLECHPQLSVNGGKAARTSGSPMAYGEAHRQHTSNASAHFIARSRQTSIREGYPLSKAQS
jgi:hypothetical protein